MVGLKISFGKWMPIADSVLYVGSVASVDVLASDYRVITEGCGLLDRSERGKLALTGAGAKEFLQGQVSNDVEALTPGSGCYAVFLTPKGKMLGDLRILDLGSELLLDTERARLQELFNLIRRFSIGFELELHKRTLERGLVSLIGPDAPELCGARGLGPEEHANAAIKIRGFAAVAVRTDVGVDLLCDSAETTALIAVLGEAGAVPVREEAVECLRVEHGRPRYGLDLDDSVIPQEAGLNERAVSFSKGCYVGQETVARLYYRGKPNRHLRGLRLSAPARTGEELHAGGRAVGRVGSVAVSPGLGPIALGFVRREVEPGATVAVGANGREARVVELPFDERG
jgi:folate-binding protein YgfZ